MGRKKSVDGTPTSLVTLRLPDHILEWYEQEAIILGAKNGREVLRDISITHALAGREVKPSPGGYGNGK